MVYNIPLSFEEASVFFRQSDQEEGIRLIRSGSIDATDFPVRLVYQNNQDRQIALYTDREFTRPENGQRWIFDVENVVRFEWVQGIFEIRYCYLDMATDDIFRFWLYHVVMPIYLSIHQIYKFLHAGAVEIEENAVLFMAPSFGGKSTMTDYFLQRGHPLITDDKLASFERGGVYYAVPSHPYHRPFRTVEVLGHRCENPAMGIKPIRAIYILQPDEADAPCSIRTLKGVEKFSRLHEGGEMNFSFFTPEYVTYLAAMANRVPVFSINVPHDLQRLGEVHDTIVEHMLKNTKQLSPHTADLRG